jgi:HK97 family phage prohead protease
VSVIIHKTNSIDSDGSEWIHSNERLDAYGDVVMLSGWESPTHKGLDDFRRNSVALFSHNSQQPIGTWENERVEDGALRGRLRLAPKGTSPQIDEIRRLVSARVIKACSIGFEVLASEPMPGGTGRRYTKQILREVSLCSVPANADCLVIAKDLNISPATLSEVFINQNDTALEARRARWREIKARATAQLADRSSEAPNHSSDDEEVITWISQERKYDWPKYTGWKGSYTGWRGDRGDE